MGILTKVSKAIPYELFCLLLVLPRPAVATPITKGPFDAPAPGTDQRIRVTEIGQDGALTWVWPTNKGDIIKNGSGVDIGFSGNLTDPLNIPAPSIDLGVPPIENLRSHTFILAKNYGKTKVTDYIQQTGDPAVLQASAFESGVMVDSLWDWLFLNGYDETNPIFQPDFFLEGGGDLYFAVDLAGLRAAGKTFVDAWRLGSVFSINASGGLDEMPFYMFSSSLFSYTEGSGWTGGTPLAQGTRVSFDAFHVTNSEVVPEPATLLLVGAGLVVGSVGRRRRTRFLPCLN